MSRKPRGKMTKAQELQLKQLFDKEQIPLLAKLQYEMGHKTSPAMLRLGKRVSERAKRKTQE